MKCCSEQHADDSPAWPEHGPPSSPSTTQSYYNKHTVHRLSDKMPNQMTQCLVYTCITEILLLHAKAMAKSVKHCRVSSLTYCLSYLYKHYKDSRQPLIQL